MKREITIKREKFDQLPELSGQPSKRSGNLRWALLAMILAAWLAVEVGKNFEDEMNRYIPETISNTSSYNKKPSGYSGLYELAERIALKPQRWQKPYRELKDKGTLIIISPGEPPQDFEVEQILKWVGKGNNLIYMDYFAMRTGKRFLNSLSLQANDSRSLTNTTLAVEKAEPVTELVSEVNLSAETRVSTGTSSDNEDKKDKNAEESNVDKRGARHRLVKDQYGDIVVAIDYGKGHCLVASAPNLACNRRIADLKSRGNFQLLANWLQDAKGKVYFDEKCHGYSEAPNVFTWLAKGPMGLVINQCLLILVIAIASLNQRFGPARLVSNPRRISNLEFIDGMAHTYRKARASETAWLILFTSFKTRLCKALGLSPATEAPELAQAWSEAAGLKESECRDFLTRAKAADATHISTEELLQLVGRCDQLSESSKNFLTLNSNRRLGG